MSNEVGRLLAVLIALGNNVSVPDEKRLAAIVDYRDAEPLVYCRLSPAQKDVLPKGVYKRQIVRFTQEFMQIAVAPE